MIVHLGVMKNQSFQWNWRLRALIDNAVFDGRIKVHYARYASPSISYLRRQLGSTGVFTYALPTTVLSKPPVEQHEYAPSETSVGSPFLMHRIFLNNSSSTCQLRVSLDSGKTLDQYAFAGNRWTDIEVLPKTTYVLWWILVPLVSGILQLPKTTTKQIIRVDEEEGPEYDDVKSDTSPPTILVKPRVYTL